MNIGGYETVRLLGKGGMGEVWKVREKKTFHLFDFRDHVILQVR